MWARRKLFPMYGVTGNSDNSWNLDIFWGNAIKNGSKAIEFVKRFKPSKISSSKIQEQSLALKLSSSIVEEAFKAEASCRAQGKAIKYMEKLCKEQPVSKT